MSQAYIYDAIRTPRGKGKPGGALYSVRPWELVSQLLQELQLRNPFSSHSIDDVVLGCVTPVDDQGAVLPRTALLMAGYDATVPGVQVNRFCGSGLEAINQAAARLRSQWAQAIIAGGVESMSRVPLEKDGGALLFDPEAITTIGYIPQGVAADLIATSEGFTRTQLDEYALLSQERAAIAWKTGRFDRSIIPVTDSCGLLILDRDQHLRPETTLESLANLQPVFAKAGSSGFNAIALSRHPELERIEHLHTAGNSSGIVDGASLLLLGNENFGLQYGLQPRAVILSAAVVGSEPTAMLTGPAPASRKALELAGLTPADIDLWEMNEAFAAPVLQFARQMNIPMDKINVNGGAIAMGHPLGATGAMLTGILLDELELRDLKRGLVTLCIGGGMGIATIIERITAPQNS